MDIELKNIDALLADHPITDGASIRFPARDSGGDGAMTGPNYLSYIMTVGTLRRLLKIPDWAGSSSYAAGRILIHTNKIVVSKIPANGTTPGSSSDSNWDVYADELAFLEGICAALL